MLPGGFPLSRCVAMSRYKAKVLSLAKKGQEVAVPHGG